MKTLLIALLFVSSTAFGLNVPTEKATVTGDILFQQTWQKYSYDAATGSLTVGASECQMMGGFSFLGMASCMNSDGFIPLLVFLTDETTVGQLLSASPGSFDPADADLTLTVYIQKLFSASPASITINGNVIKKENCPDGFNALVAGSDAPTTSGAPPEPTMSCAKLETTSL